MPMEFKTLKSYLANLLFVDIILQPINGRSHNQLSAIVHKFILLVPHCTSPGLTCKKWDWWVNWLWALTLIWLWAQPWSVVTKLSIVLFAWKWRKIALSVGVPNSQWQCFVLFFMESCQLQITHNHNWSIKPNSEANQLRAMSGPWHWFDHEHSPGQWKKGCQLFFLHESGRKW